MKTFSRQAPPPEPERAPPPEPERAPPPEPERARRSPSRHQVQSEAAFGARIERLTQELAAKTRSVQELSRTVERLQRERKGLLSGSWSREARPANANANAAARPRAAASGDARVGGAGVGGGGDEAGAGEVEERFPAAQYEKTYRPDAFAGSHITEVLEENQALREQLGRLEERPDAGEPHGALAQAREELCRYSHRKRTTWGSSFFKSNPVRFRITDWIKSWKWVFRDSELRSDHVIRSYI